MTSYCHELLIYVCRGSTKQGVKYYVADTQAAHRAWDCRYDSAITNVKELSLRSHPLPDTIETDELASIAHPEGQQIQGTAHYNFP